MAEKVMITGGTGFLGQHLVEFLLQQGYDVAFCGRSEERYRCLSNQGARFFKVDIRDASLVSKAISGADVVVHCAALSSPWGKYRDFYQANVLGTRNVCDAAAQSGVRRLVHISSPSIYFEFRDRENVLETDPLPKHQVNHYSRTKLLAEKEIDRLLGRIDSAVVLRPRGIFGSGDNSILSRILKASATTGLPLIRDGKFWIDITHVSNVVSAVNCAIRTPTESLNSYCASSDLQTAVFNITNGETYEFARLIDLISTELQTGIRLRPLNYKSADLLARTMELTSRFTGTEPTLTRYTVGLIAFSQTLNINFARRILNYQPTISIAQGIKELATSKARM